MSRLKAHLIQGSGRWDCGEKQGFGEAGTGD